MSTAEENKEECQYLDLLKHIMDNGTWETGRNGRVKTVFGNMMRFSLADGRIPILTTKKTAWKTCLKELLWFIHGKMDNKILKEQGVHIWDANGSREFLDSRGLKNYEVDELGPCFAKGTLVLTNNGYKPIETIKTGENVYTHLGNCMPVVELMKKEYTGIVYNIRPKRCPLHITCTPEHPFYAKKYIVRDRIKVNGVEKRNVVFSDKPDFVKAEDLIKGEYMLGIKLDTNNIIPEFVINDKLTKIDDEDFWWMMGLFVGDGWLVYEKVGNYERHRIHFVIANHQIEEYLPKLLKHIPNLKEKISHDTTRDTGCKTYYCTNKDIANILVQFGKYAHGKYIPQFVHQAPKHLIRAFLDGYVSADGCVRVQKTNKSTRLTTVSDDLAYSAQRLYAKIGYIATISYSVREGKQSLFPHGKICNIRNAYSLEVYLNDKRRSDYCHIENDYLWFTIYDININNVANMDVYNLSVVNDNSYIVNNVAVHNCYGYQWRHFNAPYNCFAGNSSDELQGVDQLQQIIDALKHPTERFSRRLIMTAWNPCQLDQMALPPCHVLCQFNVQDGNKLSCALFQRSNDEACGTALNIASYSFLTHLLAKHCGLVAHEFVYMKGNCHIYEEHIEGLKTQMERKPYPFPTVSIKQVRDNINDYTVDDFVIKNYQHHDPIKFVMVA